MDSELMEFRILGPVEVRRDGAAVHVGASKQRALLGVLLLHPDETVSTARLVDALWGERPPATAEKLVQGYVSALRKQLGDGVLETQAPGYAIRLGDGFLDLSEFERLTTWARDAHASAAVELRGDALRLWRGSPLADVSIEGDERHVLARLNELRLATQIEQIDAELALGRHAALVGELEELAATHPYKEKLAAQRMLALYRSGRQTEALDAYRTIRDRLDDELGLQPGEELRGLEAAILRQDAGLAAPPSVDPAPAADGREDGEQAPPAARRNRRLVPLLVAAMLAAAVIVASLTLARRDPAPVTVPPNAVAVIDPSTNRVRDVVPVGIRPGPIAAADGAVWVGNLDDASLSRIDPESEIVVKNVPLPATPDAVASGARVVWIANGRLGTLYRVDPAFDRVTGGRRLATRSISFTGAGVDFGLGSVWAVFGDSTLAQVDPAALERSELATAGEGPAAVFVAFGSVWVSNSASATVERFSPLTFAEGPIREFSVGRRPTGLAAGAGSIWVASTDDDYVTRLVVTDLGFESARVIPVGDGPTGVAFGSGSAWVVNTAEGTVSRIDPESNTVEATITVGNAPAGVAVADGSVWVTVQAP